MKSIQVESPRPNDPFSPSCLSIVLAPVFAISPLVACFLWIYRGLPEELRGLTQFYAVNWNDSVSVWKTFNWHPMLMTFFFTLGALALFCFKMLPMGHFAKKLLHGFFHAAALGCGIASLVIIVWWKKHTGNVEFWTLHSWIGIAAFGLYCLQFLSGFFFFLVPGAAMFSKSVRAFVVIDHRHAGLIIWILVAVSLVTGYMGRQWLLYLAQGNFEGASNPRFAAYWSTNSVVLFSCALIAFVLFVFRHIKPEQDEHHYSPLGAVDYS